MANNRICLACGKAYEYCGSCPSSLNLPVWKNIFDTENCKTVFETGLVIMHRMQSLKNLQRKDYLKAILLLLLRNRYKIM